MLFVRLTGCFLLLCFWNGVPVVAQSIFTGRYTGDQQGVKSTASLQTEDKRLKGTVTLNGKSAALSGTVKDSSFTGTLRDAETRKDYSCTGYVTGNELHVSITFPELDNQAVELIMKKETEEKVSVAKPVAGKRDTRLIGTWRYTEVISSGSGGNYGSFSADYFMEFKADGTVYSWTGSATASGGGVGAESNGSGKKEKGEWRTDGNKLILTDPVTKQSATVLFAADASRILLHNGGPQKKIWERIQ